MKPTCLHLLLTLTIALSGHAFAQDKKRPEKLIELPQLTDKIAEAKLKPIWTAHKCDDPEIYYFILYGSASEERDWRAIIVRSVGSQCDYPGFRITLIEGPPRKKGAPAVVLWRTWPGGENPAP